MRTIIERIVATCGRDDVRDFDLGGTLESIMFISEGIGRMNIRVISPSYFFIISLLLRNMNMNLRDETGVDADDDGLLSWSIFRSLNTEIEMNVTDGDKLLHRLGQFDL